MSWTIRVRISKNPHKIFIAGVFAIFGLVYLRMDLTKSPDIFVFNILSSFCEWGHPLYGIFWPNLDPTLEKALTFSFLFFLMQRSCVYTKSCFFSHNWWWHKWNPQIMYFFHYNFKFLTYWEKLFIFNVNYLSWFSMKPLKYMLYLIRLSDWGVILKQKKVIFSILRSIILNFEGNLIWSIFPI